MIAGVVVTPLRQIVDERGKVMHMLRADAPHFQGFGEIYFSTVHPGMVKGWHRQKRMVLNYAVPVGLIKMVLFDDREGSPTRGEIAQLYLGPDSYQLVTVPPMVWTGFKGCGDSTSMVANCGSVPHNSAETERLDPSDPAIPYDWGKLG